MTRKKNRNGSESGNENRNRSVSGASSMYKKDAQNCRQLLARGLGCRQGYTHMYMAAYIYGWVCIYVTGGCA